MMISLRDTPVSLIPFISTTISLSRHLSLPYQLRVTDDIRHTPDRPPLSLLGVLPRCVKIIRERCRLLLRNRQWRCYVILVATPHHDGRYGHILSLSYYYDGQMLVSHCHGHWLLLHHGQSRHCLQRRQAERHSTSHGCWRYWLIGLRHVITIMSHHSRSGRDDRIIMVDNDIIVIIGWLACARVRKRAPRARVRSACAAVCGARSVWCVVVWAR